MYISKAEKQLALRISKKIQHFIEITNSTNLRSTDVFPYLQRQGFFKEDKENGKELRVFLKKLYRNDMLKTLVPQCYYIPSLNNPHYGEWHFHSAKYKRPTIKHAVKMSLKRTIEDSLVPNKFDKLNVKMDINEAIEIVQKLIAGINPITERPQDDLGVCADITVVEALKTIIDPEIYRVEISKIEKDIVESKKSQEIGGSEKYLSASALGKLVNKSYDEILITMNQNGLILGPHIIRKKGVEAGLILRQNSKGNKWIVYPESLAEIL